MVNKQLIVFTDLDGTLLDHHTYSFEAAIETLERLHRLKIPVIPVTSKTYSELKILRERIGLNGPFVIENGAAIHIPHGFFTRKPSNTQWVDQHWVRQFTSRKQYWLNLLQLASRHFPESFTHFTQMGTEQIAEVTGLSLEDASRAAARQYGEPVMWLGSEEEKQQFINFMTEKGARPLQGGRFIHISGECDKGVALRWFMQEFSRQYPTTDAISIALGDGGNDVAMLEAGDISVKIKSPVNPYPEIEKQEQVIATTSCGPQGWSEAINQILSENI